MFLLNPRLLMIGALALLGCATARPLFEQEFINGSPTALHDAWMRNLQSRYGCDTMYLHVRLISVWRRPTDSGQPSAGVGGGSLVTPCEMAGFQPTVVRVWATRDGIREDWMRTRVVRFRFRGTDTLNLHATPDLLP